MTAISPPDRLSAAGADKFTPSPAAPTKALLWLGSGASLLFLVPLIGTDVLGLQPVLYDLCYFTLALVFLALFAMSHAGAGSRPRRRRAGVDAALFWGAEAFGMEGPERRYPVR